MKYIFPFLSFVFLVLLSCEKDENLNTDHYIVNGFFSDKIPLLVHTANTLPVFDTLWKYPEVNDLNGKIYENDKLLGDLVYRKLDQTDFGYRPNVSGYEWDDRFNLYGYTLQDYNLKQGNNYKIELYNDEGIVMYANDIIPDEVEFNIVDTTSFIYKPDDLPEEYIDTVVLSITLEINDPLKTQNFYALAAECDAYDNEGYLLGKNEPWVTLTDPVIEASYHHFNLPCIRRYIFTDEHFNGEKYIIRMDVTGIYYGLEDYSGQLNIYLFSLSEKHYKYIKSTIKQRENNEDLYAEPVQVYDNIENGYGIFAGFTYHKETINY